MEQLDGELTEDLEPTQRAQISRVRVVDPDVEDEENEDSDNNSHDHW